MKTTIAFFIISVSVVTLEARRFQRSNSVQIDQTFRTSNKLLGENEDWIIEWEDVDIVGDIKGPVKEKLVRGSANRHQGKQMQVQVHRDLRTSNRLFDDGNQVIEWNDIEIVGGENDIEGPIIAKIVGGNEAKPHSHPHQISLQEFNYAEQAWQHFCGGSIIKANKILTAAHCIQGHDNQFLRVVAGDHDIYEPEGTEQHSGIESIISHPKYNPVTYNFDYAILYLSQPFTLNEHVSKIELAPRGFVPLSDCVISGWGSTTTDNEPAKLQDVNLRYVSRDDCNQLFKGSKKVTSRMICAGGRGGEGICNGDSGGPLVCDGLLAGVTSWGSVPCGEFPGVFADVGAQRKWIDTN